MGRRGSRRKSGSPRSIPVYPSAELTVPGQRRAVWEGRAQKTRGGLTRSDLVESRSTGKIVSKRASDASRRNFERNGLRPDRNIAYKGAQYRGARAEQKRESTEEGAYEDWDAILTDVSRGRDHNDEQADELVRSAR